MQPVLPDATAVGALSAEAVRKLGEILQTIEQSNIFRDFSDSERSKASKKRTKPVRVKSRGSFYTACARLRHSLSDTERLILPH
jgi:hypothetical protein